MQSWNATFSLFFLVGNSLWGGVISGRVRALNLTVPLGSGQTISGSGFSFEPVQTSTQGMLVPKTRPGVSSFNTEYIPS